MASLLTIERNIRRRIGRWAALVATAIAAIAGGGCATIGDTLESADSHPVEDITLQEQDPGAADSPTPVITPTVVAQYPHDANAFTQGLEWWGPYLVEGTGLRGQSSIRLTSAETGRVIEQYDLPENLFGEGVTVIGNSAIQVTFTSQVLFKFGLSEDEIEPLESRADAYVGQGWGLCYDGTQIAMSNGSDRIQFRHPDTFAPTHQVAVRLDGDPVFNLNELECQGGLIWANIWMTESIVAIDPGSGKVVLVVDATALVPEDLTGDTDAVLNGIAYRPETETFWLTGKLWPVMYEVTFNVP